MCEAGHHDDDRSRVGSLNIRGITNIRGSIASHPDHGAVPRAPGSAHQRATKTTLDQAEILEDLG